MDDNQNTGSLVKWIGDYIEKTATSSFPEISQYVNKLREQNPGITDEGLAIKIVNRKSLKSGLIGAATGVGGITTLPITIPANLLMTWQMQIYLALTIAYIFGHNKDTTDLKRDIFLILAGNSAVEALRKAGIEIGKSVTKKAIEKNVSREVMKKIWKVIPQKVITKAGEKSFLSFNRMVPLIGAPIGFGFDYIATKSLGHLAIKYYSGQ